MRATPPLPSNMNKRLRARGHPTASRGFSMLGIGVSVVAPTPWIGEHLLDLGEEKCPKRGRNGGIPTLPRTARELRSGDARTTHWNWLGSSTDRVRGDAQATEVDADQRAEGCQLEAALFACNSGAVSTSFHAAVFVRTASCTCSSRPGGSPM